MSNNLKITLGDSIERIITAYAKGHIVERNITFADNACLDIYLFWSKHISYELIAEFKFMYINSTKRIFTEDTFIKTFRYGFIDKDTMNEITDKIITSYVKHRLLE